MEKLEIKNFFEAGRVAVQARWIYVALIFAVGIMIRVAGDLSARFSSSLIAILLLVSVVSNCGWYFFRWLYPKKDEKSAKILSKVIFFQYFLDLLIVTIIIHFAGGIESISFIFYFFVIVASSFVYNQGRVFLIALIAILFYNLLIFFEYFRIINTYLRYEFSNLTLHYSFDAVTINTFTVSAVILASALFVGYLSEARKRQEKLAIAEKGEKIRAIKKTEEIRSRFVTVITYQLRTPLTHIKLALSSFTEIKRTFPEFHQEILKEGIFSVERILSLINRLVKIKDLESEKIFWEKENISLGKIVKKTIATFSGLANQKGMEIVFSTGEANLENYKIKGNKELLSMVCEIILENAIVYGEANSKIEVAIMSKNGFLEIFFTNSGLGISNWDKQKIFLPFFRSQEAMKAEPNRDGLGLYLANLIVKKHQGKILLRSVSPEETTFVLRLPRF